MLLIPLTLFIIMMGLMALCLILLMTYYAKNHASIIGGSLRKTVPGATD